MVPSHHDEGTVYVTQRGREDTTSASTSTGQQTSKDIHEHRIEHTVGVGERHPRGPTTASRCSSGPTWAFVSVTGKQWWVLGGNLPSVQVSDLSISLATA